MKRELVKTLPYNEVQFRWILSHYDVHLKGTCIYNNELCEFENNYPKYNEEIDDWDEMFVNIYKIDFITKLKWYWRQWKFEKLVGYYSTYPYRKQSKGFYYRKPKWLYIWFFNKYFKR
jgi:hypothetical protein